MKKIHFIEQVRELFNVPDEAVDFLKATTVNTPNGRYEFGDGCYVNVMNSEMKMPTDASLMEAHDKYIDVQVLIDGEEKILYADKDGLLLAKAYDPQKDIAFYRFEEAAEVCYQAGEAVVLDTAEAHLPGCCVTQPITVKKAVMKILK